MASERFSRVLARVDQLNGEDPNQDFVEGKAHPRELLYSERLSAWVLRLEPNPSEELCLAARGQHVCRWTIPRSRYPMNRQGYLRWRETLKTFHAQTVAKLMREEGYPEDRIQRVQTIMSKRHLADDAESQILEDALCLLFLETQFSDLRRKTPPEKMRDVLQKTWRKMSARGRKMAQQIELGEAERRLLREAVKPD